MIDRHHCLHFRSDWTSRKEAHYLRGRPQHIPHIPRETHVELHANCPQVPLLGFYALREVANNYEQREGVIQSIEALILAIEKAAKSPRAHRIEKELALLAAQALELQLPYIKDGLTSRAKA